MHRSKREPVRLTDNFVRTLTCAPGKSEEVIFDKDLPGYGCRVRAHGGRTRLVQYAIHGRTRRVFFGPNMTDSVARPQAEKILARARLGEDPAAEKVLQRAEAANTFGALLPRFIERQRTLRVPRYVYEQVRHLERRAKPLHSNPLANVGTPAFRRELATLLAKLAEKHGARESDCVRSSLSAYFGWLAREGYVESNPVAFINKAAEGDRSRSRRPKVEELAVIWRALGDSEYAMVIRLLMLTGMRRAEIGALRFDEIDFHAAIIILPKTRTKSKREFVIPLAPAALEILKRRRAQVPADNSTVFGRVGRGFTNWSNQKLWLNQRLIAAGTPVPDWDVHDFRRSVSTSLHEDFSIPPHVVEAILGHVIPGVGGIYNRAIYLDERRRALEKWAEYLFAAVIGEPQQAPVYTLHR
jgi:integrase